jgi:hypothetical protein
MTKDLAQCAPAHESLPDHASHCKYRQERTSRSDRDDQATMTCTFGSAASARAAAGPGRSSPRPSQRPRRPADWRIHREEHKLATSDVDGPRVSLPHA